LKIVFDTGESIPFDRFCGNDLKVCEVDREWYVIGRNDIRWAGPTWEDARRLKFYFDRLHQGNEQYADPRCMCDCSNDCCDGKKQIYRTPKWMTKKPKRTFLRLSEKPRMRSGEWVYVEHKPEPIRDTLGKNRHKFHFGWYQ
jgi:hypothetical protein